MSNIFENAKFGDRFITRDGRIAVYVSYCESLMGDFYHYLLVENSTYKGTIPYYDNGKAVKEKDCFDIVPIWEGSFEQKMIKEKAKDMAATIKGGYIPTDALEKYFRSELECIIKRNQNAKDTI